MLAKVVVGNAVCGVVGNTVGEVLCVGNAVCGVFGNSVGDVLCW